MAQIQQLQRHCRNPGNKVKAGCQISVKQHVTHDWLENLYEAEVPFSLP